nr:DUF6320 domain-containing protein [uncultured Caproiciproducens sp.]
MMYCSKCKLSVKGQRKYCPLCQNELEYSDDAQDEVFPEIPTMFHLYNLFFRILILTSVAVSVISVVINAMYPAKIWWSFFVAAGIVCFWISMAIAVSKRRNIPKNILYQVVVISVLAVVWDLCMGWRAWSVDYVIPVICTLAMLSMAIIAKIANLHARDYIIYLVIDGMFGIIPVILVITGIVRIQFPSLICTGASIIFLTALLLFEGENMRGELRRRLHM